MSWSVLQSNSGGPSGGGNVTAAYTANLSSGTKLIAYTFTDNNSGTDVTGVNDGNGNNFTLVPSANGSSSFIPVCDIWVLDTPAGDVGTKPTITATAAASNHTGILIQEVSGLAAGTSASFDGTAGTATGLNTTPTSASYSSTASNEFLVTSFADDFGSNPTWTVPSGYTQDPKSVQSAANTMGFAVAYKNSTGGAESAVWTTSSNSLGWGTVLAAFKLAAAAAGQSYPLIPPGRQSPQAFQWHAWPTAAPVLVPVSDSDSGSGADSGSAVLGSPPPVQPLTPPGRLSPMAWQWHAQPTGAPVLVPVSDSDSGSGTESQVAGPPVQSWPLTPPGRQSPQAFQFQSWPSAAPVLVPVSDSDSGTGADSGSAAIGTPPTVQPLTPPGRQSPMAWQFQAGPTGAPVLVPVSDSDSGTGTESAYAGPPVQSQVLVPPGRVSPAGWQWRTLPSGAPLLVPVSDSDSGSGADSGSVSVLGTAPAAPLIPPGRSSPMALGWQRWPSAVAPAAPVTMVSDSDSGTFADVASFTPVIDPPPTGGWWQLDSIIKYARQEREFYATRPPMACPRCGEPMRPAPPSDTGSEVELYCLFDGFQYPRDWRPPFPV